MGISGIASTGVSDVQIPSPERSGSPTKSLERESGTHVQPTSRGSLQHGDKLMEHCSTRKPLPVELHENLYQMGNGIAPKRRACTQKASV